MSTNELEAALETVKKLLEAKQALDNLYKQSDIDDDDEENDEENFISSKNGKLTNRDKKALSELHEIKKWARSIINDIDSPPNGPDKATARDLGNVYYSKLYFKKHGLGE